MHRRRSPFNGTMQVLHWVFTVRKKNRPLHNKWILIGLCVLSYGKKVKFSDDFIFVHSQCFGLFPVKLCDFYNWQCKCGIDTVLSAKQPTAVATCLSTYQLCASVHSSLLLSVHSVLKYNEMLDFLSTQLELKGTHHNLHPFTIFMAMWKKSRA